MDNVHNDFSEVKAILADFGSKMHELHKSQEKTDILFANLHKSQEKTDLQIAQTDKQIAELRKSQSQTDKQIGGISNNMGAATTEFFYNSFKYRNKKYVWRRV